jgi:hypothetical protein
MGSVFKILLSIMFFTTGLRNESNIKPVKWTYEFKKTADKEYDLIFKARIEKGYHLYSQHIDEGGPIPTSFSFNSSESYQRIDSVKEISKAKRVHDPNFDMDLIYYSNSAEFVQHVKINGVLKPITGTLQYMVCDDKKCFPPEDVDFAFDLTK